MSLALKGTDLPTDVYRVFVVIEGENEETLYRNTVEYKGEALKAVVQIPKKHGRLIDAKLLADTINKAIQEGTFISKSIWEWIAESPTILEAESEE